MAINIRVADENCVEVAERVTATEFLHSGPEDRKAELIDGVIVEPMPPLEIHEKLFSFLYRLLSAYVEELDLGIIRGSRTPVVLNDYYAPEPDILFVANERLDVLRREGVFGSPDLIIEILSASTAQYDRGPKFLAYEEASVKELWLIDPYGPVGTDFYQLEKGSFRSVHPNADRILKSVAIPGFWINVNWLWPGDDKFIPVGKVLNQILQN